jgi:hypothetical protein
MRTPRDIAMAIVDRIAASRGVLAGDILSHARRPAIDLARREARIAVSREFPSWSITQIARFFHRRHPTLIRAFREAGHFHPGLFPDRAPSPPSIDAHSRSSSVSDIRSTERFADVQKVFEETANV